MSGLFPDEILKFTTEEPEDLVNLLDGQTYRVRRTQFYTIDTAPDTHMLANLFIGSQSPVLQETIANIEVSEFQFFLLEDGTKHWAYQALHVRIGELLVSFQQQDNFMNITSVLTSTGITQGGHVKLPIPMRWAKVATMPQSRYDSGTVQQGFLQLDSSAVPMLEQQVQTTHGYRDYGKKVPIKDLVPGTTYRTRSGSAQFCYIGKIAGQGLWLNMRPYGYYSTQDGTFVRTQLLSEAFKWEDTKSNEVLDFREYWNSYEMKKSHSFTIAMQVVMTPEEAVFYANKAIKNGIRDARTNLFRQRAELEDVRQNNNGHNWQWKIGAAERRVADTQEQLDKLLIAGFVS